MVWVIAPVLHNQLLPALAVRLTDPPVQKEVGPPAFMVAVGKLFTVNEAVCAQPLLFV